MLARIERENKRCKYSLGVDLTFVEPRLMEISSVITARYDAGICKHRLERTGVIEIEREIDEEDTNNSK